MISRVLCTFGDIPSALGLRGGGGGGGRDITYVTHSSMVSLIAHTHLLSCRPVVAHTHQKVKRYTHISGSACFRHNAVTDNDNKPQVL